MLLTLSHMTSRDRVHRHTDQGETGRGRRGQSSAYGLEHSTTGHAYHGSPLGTFKCCHSDMSGICDRDGGLSPPIRTKLDVIDLLLEVEMMKYRLLVQIDQYGSTI